MSTYPEIDGTFPHKYSLYLNSMCPSTIRKLKAIVDFRKVFLLSKFKSICFATILPISLKSRSCKKDYILFNVPGTSILEARNIRLVNINPSIIEESKFISENMPPNVYHC